MTFTRSPSLRRDLLSAYVASAAKVGSWVVVSGLLVRFSTADYAMFSLARGTVGLLTYLTLGLGPALVRAIAHAAVTPRRVQPADDDNAVHVLSYAMRPDVAATTSPITQVYSAAIWLSLACTAGGLVAAWAYGLGFDRLHRVPAGYAAMMPATIMCLGIGTLLRLAGEVPGAVLQANGRIAIDNAIVAGGELLWLFFFAVGSSDTFGMKSLIPAAAATYAFSGGVALLVRWWEAGYQSNVFVPRVGRTIGRAMWGLFSFGVAVSLAQLADFLYAPTDYVLINRFLAPIAVATYAPAVQVDAAIALLVSAMAAVLLPRAAIAHAGGDRDAVRRYYVKGTLASIAIVVPAAIVAYLVSPIAFRIWLGRDMPATHAILPLVLLHNIMGSSAFVGRSILLAMGRAKAFAGSVLVAGAINVVCSWWLVTHTSLGLAAIVWGTVIAVALRCVLWTPWYVLRTLKRAERVDVEPVVVVPDVEVA